MNDQQEHHAMQLFQTRFEPHILEYWDLHADDLERCTLIRATAGESNMPLPQRTDLECGAFLRGLFAQDHLFFCDQRIMENTKRLEISSLSIDYTLSFDAMIPSYIAKAMQTQHGQPDNLAQKGFDLLDFLTAHNLNIDVVPFLIENARNMTPGRLASSPKFRANLRAIETVRDLNDAHYLSTRELRPNCSEVELQQRIEGLIVFGQELHIKYGAEFAHVQNVCYAILLQASIIQISKPSSSLEDKLERLLEFCDQQLGALMWREIVYALSYFEHGDKQGFFARVKKKNLKLFTALDNMAWDCQIAHHLQWFMSVMTKDQRIAVTYLVTFDQDLARTMDTYAVEQMFYIQGEYPLINPINVQTKLRTFVTDMAALEGKYLNESARARRAALDHSPERLATIITALESQLKIIAQVP